MPSLPTREEILEALRAEGRALTVRELGQTLGARGRRAEAGLEALLEELSQEELLKALPGGTYRAAAPLGAQASSWQGVFSGHARGFGFVAAPGQEDLYVPPTAVGGALHGDRVEVEVTARTRRGVEGRVVAVLSRRVVRVAGVLRKRGRSAWLEPDDSRLRGPIALTPDAGGLRGAVDGDAAVVRLVRYPATHDENPEGELVAVLGKPGTVKAEVAKILLREQIEESHPAAAVTEAESMASRLARGDYGKRVDLRHVPLPTIDPEDARDHDDAVWVERTEDGYRAYVAIADVSEYVQPGTALDQEAEARGCTIYLPDRAIPMLPSALAADMCSLLPERDRLCLCVIMELDRQGEPTKHELVEAVMRSAAMLTYGGVARTLGFSETPPASKAAEAFKKDLRVIDELARKLRRRRFRRGALDLDLPEAKVRLDPETGMPVEVTRRTEDPGVKRAYEMIEELMLLANETVAEWLGARRCPTLYRVHAKPDEAKLERLAEVAEQLGVAVRLGDLQDAIGFTRWLATLKSHPRGNVLSMLLLRSLKQAVYDVTNIGHFGLASNAYLHFTSPIRRYPDLLVHRAVKALLRGARPDTSASATERLQTTAATSSARERSAMEVEREVLDLYRALFMRERIGETFEGVVTALVGSGAYVALDEPFVDVLVRFESMGPDRYELADDELSVVGSRSGDTLRLGDRVRVVIEDVALLRRTTYGRRIPPVGADEASEPASRGKRDERGKTRAREERPAGARRGSASGASGASAAGGKNGGSATSGPGARRTEGERRGGARSGTAGPSGASAASGPGGRRAEGERRGAARSGVAGPSGASATGARRDPRKGRGAAPARAAAPSATNPRGAKPGEPGKRSGGKKR